MKIYMVRHGETSWNRRGIYQGQTYTTLNEKGRDEAKKLAGALKNIKFSSIYSSDLPRTRETAEIINSYLNVPLFYDSNLREMNFGRWTGMSISDIERVDPDLFKRWRDDPWNVSPPNGETFKELTDRVVRSIEGICSKHKEENVLVVSHAGAIRAIILHLLRADPKAYWNIRISHSTIVLLERKDDYRISMFSQEDFKSS